MRLQGHSNILKRLLVHVAGLNLGLLLRQAIGAGTPRGLRGGVASAVCGLIGAVCGPVERSGAALDAIPAPFGAGRRAIEPPTPSASHLNTEDFYHRLSRPRTVRSFCNSSSYRAARRTSDKVKRRLN